MSRHYTEPDTSACYMPWGQTVDNSQIFFMVTEVVLATSSSVSRSEACREA